MKKVTITFLTIVLCLTSSIVSSETIKESDLVVRDGILHKKFTNIPFTGSVEGNGVLGGSEKGTYKAGKKDGVWEEYHKNGRLFQKGTYKDNKKVGVWETYWENGELQSKMPYKNNERDGDYETYYDNGQLRTKGTFKNDQFIKVDKF